MLDLPCVAVTHRPLLATGDMPVLERSATSPLSIQRSAVAYWVYGGRFGAGTSERGGSHAHPAG